MPTTIGEFSENLFIPAARGSETILPISSIILEHLIFLYQIHIIIIKHHNLGTRR